MPDVVLKLLKPQGEILINLCQNNKIKLRQEKFSKKNLDY